jgi:hypothetical protein
MSDIGCWVLGVGYLPVFGTDGMNSFAAGCSASRGYHLGADEKDAVNSSAFSECRIPLSEGQPAEGSTAKEFIPSAQKTKYPIPAADKHRPQHPAINTYP